jgi:hypothetical protein
MDTTNYAESSRGRAKPLSASNLSLDFGPRSPACKQSVAKLYRIFRSGHSALPYWKRRLAGIYGMDWQRSAKTLGTLAEKLGIACAEFAPDAFLFALQSYYAGLLELLVRRFSGLEEIVFFVEPFCADVWHDAELSEVREQLSAAMGKYLPGMVNPDPGTSGDLLRALYQQLFPRRLRRQLGEYYTPDWLTGHLLDQVGYTGRSKRRLLDPACGSGTFLMMAIKRVRKAWSALTLGDAADGAKAELCRQILSQVAGADLNPLAVMTARTNYLIAIHDLLPLVEAREIPVYLGDTILDDPPLDACREELFDVVAGNPPWIAWDNLPADYREATKPLWEYYGLFTLSGNEARHGGGKKDLSMLMLYAVADRYLKVGGRLGFVITQTAFQTKGAGDGFRRFRLGKTGQWLSVQRVDDFINVRPFADAANWTSSVIIEKGRPTQYPVPYFKWQTLKNANKTTPLPLRDIQYSSSLRASGPGGSGDAQGEDNEKIVLTPFYARPIEKEQTGSPWLLVPEGASEKLEEIVGPSDYQAHLGANTGGANGVYWVQLLGQAQDGVRVRNLPERGKAAGKAGEYVIEPDLIYPLLRWKDVARYSARPGSYLLLVQDCFARSGIDEELMRRKYPRTLAYLEQFQKRLNGRAAYRRYQKGRPFYSMYNVGPYTTAPIKVVWRRMDRRLSAAVVTSLEDPFLGPRAVIPQETCVLIACGSLEEAHYICAVLNSALVNHLVQAHSVSGGKGFGTPSILDYLNLRCFDPENRLHKELAACSRTAHQQINAELESRMEQAVEELYGVCKMTQ